MTSIEDYPIHMQADVRRQQENGVYPPIVCRRCNGTGNELLSMYRKCQGCHGRGYVSLQEVSDDYECSHRAGLRG